MLIQALYWLSMRQRLDLKSIDNEAFSSSHLPRNQQLTN